MAGADRIGGILYHHEEAQPPVMTAERVLGEAHLPVVDEHFLTALPDWLRDVLHGCTSGAISEAWTVLAQLLANAYRHAAPPYLVRVTAERQGFLIRLAVTDGSGRGGAAWDLRRGLRVVRGLCPSWGVTPDAGDGAHGKTVWAELLVLVPPRQ